MNNDKDLVQRSLNGDMLAFRDLVERYKKKIYYLAYDLSGNHHNAEDLSQEVFIKAFRFLKDFRGDSDFSCWLYRITVNTYISEYRKKSRSLIHLWPDSNDQNNYIKENDSSINPERSVESKMLQKHIEYALQKLSSRERSIFSLRHYNDLSLKEISHTLNITIGTVKSTLFRAIKKLQKELSFYRQDLGLEDSR